MVATQQVVWYYTSFDIMQSCDVERILYERHTVSGSGVMPSFEEEIQWMSWDLRSSPMIPCVWNTHFLGFNVSQFTHSVLSSSSAFSAFLNKLAQPQRFITLQREKAPESMPRISCHKANTSLTHYRPKETSGLKPVLRGTFSQHHSSHVKCV